MHAAGAEHEIRELVPLRSQRGIQPEPSPPRRHVSERAIFAAGRAVQLVEKRRARTSLLRHGPSAACGVDRRHPQADPRSRARCPTAGRRPQSAPSIQPRRRPCPSATDSGGRGDDERAARAGRRAGPDSSCRLPADSIARCDPILSIRSCSLGPHDQSLTYATRWTALDAPAHGSGDGSRIVTDLGATQPLAGALLGSTCFKAVAFDRRRGSGISACSGNLGKHRADRREHEQDLYVAGAQSTLLRL
jgi:hypothetical protein